MLEKCEDCLCVECEINFGTIKEECNCKICITECADSVGWCKQYREKEEIVINGKQESLF